MPNDKYPICDAAKILKVCKGDYKVGGNGLRESAGHLEFSNFVNMGYPKPDAFDNYPAEAVEHFLRHIGWSVCPDGKIAKMITEVVEEKPACDPVDVLTEARNAYRGYAVAYGNIRPSEARIQAQEALIQVLAAERDHILAGGNGVHPHRLRANTLALDRETAALEQMRDERDRVRRMVANTEFHPPQAPGALYTTNEQADLIHALNDAHWNQGRRRARPDMRILDEQDAAPNREPIGQQELREIEQMLQNLPPDLHF